MALGEEVAMLEGGRIVFNQSSTKLDRVAVFSLWIGQPPHPGKQVSKVAMTNCLRRLR